MHAGSVLLVEQICRESNHRFSLLRNATLVRPLRTCATGAGSGAARTPIPVSTTTVIVRQQEPHSQK